MTATHAHRLPRAGIITVVLIAGASALFGLMLGTLIGGRGWVSQVVPLGVTLTACLMLGGAYAAYLLSRARESRDLQTRIGATLGETRNSLERTQRLARADEIIAFDPEGGSIDPEQEPELFRLFLHHTGRISNDELAAFSNRDAALARLEADTERLVELTAGIGASGTEVARSDHGLRRIDAINRALSEVKQRLTASR